MISLLDMLARLQEAKANGTCQPGEEQAVLGAMLPEGYHDAYRCPVCYDTGLVTCVSTLRRRKDGTPYHSTCLARCVECQAGADVGKRENPPPDYDEHEHARVRPTASGDEAAEAVGKLLERRQAAKRVAGFDEFNQRGQEWN